MILWFFGGKIHTNIKQISGHNQVAAGSPDILGSQDIFKFPTPDFQTYNPGIFGISKKSLTTVFKYFSKSPTYRLKQLVLRPLITAEVSTITFQTFDYFKTSQELRILSRSLSDQSINQSYISGLFHSILLPDHSWQIIEISQGQT